MNKSYRNDSVKNTYRIKQHVTNYNGKIHIFYTIEMLTFKFFFLETWSDMIDFEPISKFYTFSSIEEAKNTLEKYVEYKKTLSADNIVVDKFEL
jgi:hypothetical protein